MPAAAAVRTAAGASALGGREVGCGRWRTGVYPYERCPDV